jgi:hypothetical protein
MKSSEILKYILDKIINIEKTLNLNSFQQSLILKRLNHLDNLIKNSGDIKNIPEKNNQIINSEPGKVSSPDLMPKETTNKAIENKNKLMSIEKNNKKDTNNVDLIGNINVISNESQQSGVPKMPVTQKITKVKGTHRVVVKTFNGDVVSDTNLNSSGRWQAMLSPGKYVVDVIGKGKDSISYSQSFEVVKSDHPIILPMPEMYKRHSE